MSQEVKVDLDALVGISKRLDGAAASLDAVGERAPETVDAGSMSALIVQDFSHLLTNAGNLVVTLQAGAAAVSKAGHNYSSTDAGSARAYKGD